MTVSTNTIIVTQCKDFKDMIGNTNYPTMVHNSNKATYTEQDEINDLNKDLFYLHNGLEDNINDANK